MINELADYGLISVTGTDAKKFLQGQLTCNVEKLLPEKTTLAAHCNPQGRVVSLFFLIHWNDNYYLLMQKSLLETALSALKKYAVFYKAKLEIIAIPEPLLTIITECLSQIKTHHIPHIYPETSGKFLPHELNLPELKAVDFDKGCYTGQEIIARMHYRGKSKNRLHRFRLQPNTLLELGEDVYNDQARACGTIVDVRADYALIIVHEASVHDNLFLQNNMPIHLELIT